MLQPNLSLRWYRKIADETQNSQMIQKFHICYKRISLSDGTEKSQMKHKIRRCYRKFTYVASESLSDTAEECH